MDHRRRHELSDLDPLPTLCPLCGAASRSTHLPVRAERHGRTLVRLAVPVGSCTVCPWVGIDDEVLEGVLSELHKHTLPGDDIILPSLGYDA